MQPHCFPGAHTTSPCRPHLWEQHQGTPLLRTPPHAFAHCCSSPFKDTFLSTWDTPCKRATTQPCTACEETSHDKATGTATSPHSPLTAAGLGRAQLDKWKSRSPLQTPVRTTVCVPRAELWKGTQCHRHVHKGALPTACLSAPVSSKAHLGSGPARHLHQVVSEPAQEKPPSWEKPVCSSNRHQQPRIMDRKSGLHSRKRPTSSLHFPS